MLFKYKAKNADGEMKEGEMEAASQIELARMLRADGFYVLQAKSEGEAKKVSLKSLSQLDVSAITDKIRGIPLEEKMMFSRNLSVMISSGITLTRSLEVLEKQTQSYEFKKIIKKIANDIKKGKNFSDAVMEHPKAFDKLYASMIKAGEVAGNMDEALNILASQLEKQHELRSRIRGALMYPAVIIIAMTGIGILMMITVIPQLSEIFSDLGADLPPTTKAILATSEFLTVYWWTLVFLLPVFLFAVKKFLGTSSGKRGLSLFLLHMPLFKKLSQQVNNATFARTLGSLISGGVPILEGISITSDTLSNVYYRESLVKAAEEVQKGENLFKVLEGYPNLYTPLLLEMIQVGEESGKLSELLERVAGFYEEEVADATKNLSSIIEPVLMLFIGGAVGFFAISIMQPIYGMLGQI
ncbi:MAG: type II secretion system F family protein [Candidatus Spechtbacterales bacterium]